MASQSIWAESDKTRNDCETRIINIMALVVCQSTFPELMDIADSRIFVEAAVEGVADCLRKTLSLSSPQTNLLPCIKLSDSVWFPAATPTHTLPSAVSRPLTYELYVSTEFYGYQVEDAPHWWDAAQVHEMCVNFQANIINGGNNATLKWEKLMPIHLTCDMPIANHCWI